MEPLRICHVTAELTPYVKTGGLADVTAGLARHFAATGNDVRVVLPLHSRIDRGEHPIERLEEIPPFGITLGGRTFEVATFQAVVPGDGPKIYFLDCPELYDRASIYTSGDDEHLRFLLLARGAIELCQRLAWAPDVFHCHDWHAGFLALYLRTLYAWDRLFEATRTVLTIHNLGYQGLFPSSILASTELGDDSHLLHQDDLAAGMINFLKTGILYSSVLSTVSPTYAREIQTPEHGVGLDDLLRERAGSLHGILNAIDGDDWSPDSDRYVRFPYDRSSIDIKEKNKRALLDELQLPFSADAPVIGIVSRLVAQKGLSLCEEVLPELVAGRDVRLVVLGSGEARYEDLFADLERRHRHKVCFYRGFNEELAHLIEAGADAFLMPSLYEPCGMNQMYSLRYGTVPIVRKTGGLADSVQAFDIETGTGDGIVFEHFTTDGLRWALLRALELYADKPSWRQMVENGMSRDFSWQSQGPEYIRLYRAAMATGRT